MKRKFKAIPILLSLCLLFSMGTVTALADETGPVYNAGAGAYYATLDEALAVAASGDVIYVEGDTTLSATTEVPSGVQVVIASSGSRNDTVTGNNVTGGVSSGSAYATLTIPSDVTLTVNGTLLVAGNQQSTQPKSGCLTGNYGAIDLEGTLNVANGGTLYARGMISGGGTVDALNGSTVYQLFQISDWRGGSASSLAYLATVFPFNLYEVKNIQTGAVYENGSTLIGQVYIYAGGNAYAPEVEIISDTGLLRLSSGNISTSYSSDVLSVVVNGDVQTGDLSLTLDTTYDSSKNILPFGYNVAIVIPSGSSLTITNKIKLLPGCIIENNGTLTIGSNAYLYVYNAEHYSTEYNFAGWSSDMSASVSGTGVVENSGVYAQSASSGRYNVYEYKQATKTVSRIRFAAIS